MTAALKIQGLTKKFEGFALDKVSFRVPSGSIVGLIGENGAGKTTTINAALGLIKKDSGEIEILGENVEHLTPSIKEEIGAVFDASNFSEELTPEKLDKVLKDIYTSWDQDLFRQLLDRLEIPFSRKLKTFSKGMKMKLSLAAALSHHPKLLILDEATSGLDPVMRDDILDMFLDFVQEEDHAILVSSHITSDLEKVADYIVFIHKGKIIFSKPKDELLEDYGIIKCGDEQFKALDREDWIACRRQDYEWQVLTSDRKKAEKKYPKALVMPAIIDEIMLLYVKGEQE